MMEDTQHKKAVNEMLNLIKILIKLMMNMKMKMTKVNGNGALY